MKKVLAALLAIALLTACSEQEPQGVRVLMVTSQGDVELELYPEKAPVTVANFLKLVDGSHLEGGTFYRTVSPENDNGSPLIAVIQGGLGDAESPFAPIGFASCWPQLPRHHDTG